MTVDRLRPQSTLADRHDEFAALPASVRIREIPLVVQLNLRLDPASRSAAAVAGVLGVELPTQPCTALHGTGVDVLWLGPDEWLVLVAEPGAGEVAVALRDAIDVETDALTDVSAQRTTIALTGPGARELLAKGCAIDLHPTVSPSGTCVQTLLAQTGVVVVVNDDAVSDFLLLVRASFADYLASWLIDAAAGLVPV